MDVNKYKSKREHKNVVNMSQIMVDDVSVTPVSVSSSASFQSAVGFEYAGKTEKHASQKGDVSEWRLAVCVSLTPPCHQLVNSSCEG